MGQVDDATGSATRESAGDKHECCSSSGLVNRGATTKTIA